MIFAELVGLALKVECRQNRQGEMMLEIRRHCRVWRIQRQQAIGVLSFAAALLVNAQKLAQPVVCHPRHHACFPPQRRRGEGNGGNGMAHIMLAVAKSPLAIFPRFPPVDRREAHEDGVFRQPGADSVPQCAWQDCALLQAVEKWLVMEKTGVRGQFGNRSGEEIALGGVQVAA